MHARGKERVSVENTNSGVQKSETISENYQHNDLSEVFWWLLNVFLSVCFSESET